MNDLVKWFLGLFADELKLALLSRKEILILVAVLLLGWSLWKQRRSRNIGPLTGVYIEIGPVPPRGPQVKQLPPGDRPTKKRKKKRR